MTTPCPECGIPVGAPEGQSAEAHRIEHYGGVPRKEMSKEARARHDQLAKMAASENRDTLPSEGIDAAEE
jgi:hypothetical protein